MYLIKFSEMNKSFVWFYQGSNPRSTTLDVSIPIITPNMQLTNLEVTGTDSIG